MNNFKPFFPMRTTLGINNSRMQTIKDLIRYVLTGVEDQYSNRSNAQHHSAQIFKNDINSRIFNIFQQQIVQEAAPNKGGDDGADILFSFFKSAIRRSMYGSRSISCPPFSDLALAEKFRVEFDVEPPPLEEADPSVAGAVGMAWQNFVQAETRMVCIYVLHSLVNMSEYDRIDDIQGSSEILKALGIRRQTFLLRYATFGSLLGGMTQRVVTQILAQECCYNEDPTAIKYSLIQYLRAEERTPGSWSRDSEETFQKDIAAKINTLRNNNVT